ncbi:MAG: 4-hydroxy-tetrahydrodipicolinate synthase [Candidatus Nephrothrix sp. EaCA]|nr:MAG: 4-hydroxy-tetrahydrodipicolinate synthase [Candidatus Nephrothrix sp. EaCA]
MKKLFGTGAALVTPFHENGEIDFESLKKLLSHASSLNYWVVMGTTGESATLSKDEKKQVLETVAANNPRKLPLVYGVGGNNTKAVADEIKSLSLAGVDAILSVSPYYNKPSQEGIYQHYKAIADASPVPVILYNVPARTSSNISAETALRLAEHQNIIGVKEASGNMEQCMKIACHKPADFMLISGEDTFTLALYAMGGAGVISVLANAYPETFQKIYEAVQRNDWQQARAAQFSLLAVNPYIYEEGNPVGLKYLLSLMNVCKPAVRLPMTEASAALQAKIKAVFRG